MERSITSATLCSRQVARISRGAPSDTTARPSASQIGYREGGGARWSRWVTRPNAPLDLARRPRRRVQRPVRRPPPREPGACGSEAGHPPHSETIENGRATGLRQFRHRPISDERWRSVRRETRGLLRHPDRSAARPSSGVRSLVPHRHAIRIILPKSLTEPPPVCVSFATVPYSISAGATYARRTFVVRSRLLSSSIVGRAR